MDSAVYMKWSEIAAVGQNLRSISSQAGLQLLNVLVTLILSHRSFNYDTYHGRVWITLCDWHCGLENFMLGSRSEPMQSSITACSTGQSANHLHHRVSVTWSANETNFRLNFLARQRGGAWILLELIGCTSQIPFISYNVYGVVASAWRQCNIIRLLIRWLLDGVTICYPGTMLSSCRAQVAQCYPPVELRWNNPIHLLSSGGTMLSTCRAQVAQSYPPVELRWHNAIHLSSSGCTILSTCWAQVAQYCPPACLSAVKLQNATKEISPLYMQYFLCLLFRILFNIYLNMFVN